MILGNIWQINECKFVNHKNVSSLLFWETSWFRSAVSDSLFIHVCFSFWRFLTLWIFIFLRFKIFISIFFFYFISHCLRLIVFLHQMIITKKNQIAKHCSFHSVCVSNMEEDHSGSNTTTSSSSSSTSL